jgi:hypothetical protein
MFLRTLMVNIKLNTYANSMSENPLDHRVGIKMRNTGDTYRRVARVAIDFSPVSTTGVPASALVSRAGIMYYCNNYNTVFVGEYMPGLW